MIRLSKNKTSIMTFLRYDEFLPQHIMEKAKSPSCTTNLPSRQGHKYMWGDKQKKALDKIKRVISKETLLTFPNFNEEIHIYRNATNYQLGTVIMQGSKPLALYSRKLNSAKTQYTTGEKELLSRKP